MTDRVYPSAKPNGGATAPPPVVQPPPAARKPAVSTQPLPTVKPTPNKAANLYNPNLRRPAAAATRHNQNQKPHHNRSRSTFTFRRCCCLTCCWLILLLIAVMFLAVIASAAVYILYHPDRPVFTVSNLKIIQFNLTSTPPDDTTHLTAKLNLTLGVKNPNDKKVTFSYDPVAISMNSRSINIANVVYPSFTNSPANLKVIHTVIGPNSQVIDGDDLNELNSDLKSKKRNGFPIEIVIDTMIGVKLDNMKMRKVGIRVKCQGIHGALPKAKGKVVIPALANVAKAKCKVDLRVKIWKFTF